MFKRCVAESVAGNAVIVKHYLLNKPINTFYQPRPFYQRLRYLESSVFFLFHYFFNTLKILLLKMHLYFLFGSKAQHNILYLINQLFENYI